MLWKRHIFQAKGVESMNAKENAKRIIRFDNPERIADQCPDFVVGYLGSNQEGYDGSGQHLPVGSVWEDIWGTVWHREQDGVIGFPREFPLANLVDALPNYTFPDPDDERICSRIYKQIAEGEFDRQEVFLAGNSSTTLWERSYFLVGMDNLMCYFYTEPEAVREMLHRIMDFNMGIAAHYVKAGVELVYMGDDLGTQSGLLFSKEIFEGFFMPEYRRLFDFYREHNVLINFHSCGHIVPLLENLIDLGVDVLNPIQVTANDVNEVRRITQGKMALQGGVNAALVLNGPVDEIRKETIKRMWELGQNGGYFCRPDQGLPWPEEHLAALEETVAEYGRYPLCGTGD